MNEEETQSDWLWTHTHLISFETSACEVRDLDVTLAFLIELRWPVDL